MAFEIGGPVRCAMKVSAIAMMVPLAAADCELHSPTGKLGDVSVSCSIPSSTNIDEKCCGVIQGRIDTMRPPSSPQEQQEDMKACGPFVGYVMGEAMKIKQASPPGAPPNPLAVINALPGGLTCTEKASGEGESACSLHGSVEKLSVSCEIPKVTTIAPACCARLQTELDKGVNGFQGAEPPDVKEKCASFAEYMEAHKPAPGPGPTPKVELPAGFSCTEKIGDTYANSTIVQALNWVASTSAMDVVATGLEYEVQLAAAPTKNKMILALIEMFGLGALGVDRCYLGSYCTGFIKAFTGGGLLIWTLIDYVNIVVNCFMKKEKIGSIGMSATFTNVDSAFYVVVILFALKCLVGVGKAAKSASGREVEETPEPFIDTDGTGGAEYAKMVA
jgi:hypothetical protein